jgi:hypothetical protein
MTASATAIITVTRHPQTAAEARAAVRNIRGEADGAQRAVYLYDFKTLPEELDVFGPKDGRPLYIYVMSGLPRLHVRGGNVTVHALSSWGNSITAHEGSNVTVLAGPVKISTHTEAGATLHLNADTGTKGYQQIDEGGTFTCEGDMTDVSRSGDRR